MAGAKRRNKGGKSAKKLKKSAKNKEMPKKEGKETSTNGDVEIMEVTESKNTGKNNEKKQKEKESVATETSSINKTQMKNENEKQSEAKVEQENKDNTEGVGEKAESKSGRRKMTDVKKNQEDADQGKNAHTGKRKREPEDNAKVVSVSKKKQINLTQKDKCTLFIRFPESLVVKKQSHVKTIVGIDVVDVRFPNVPRGTSKGFCYAEFKSENEAKIIKKKLEKKQVDGGPFHVEYFGEKLKREKAQTSKAVDYLRLFVGRLPKTVNQEKLRAIFPTAVKIKKQKNRCKLSYCHAYITFKTVKEAQKVLEASKGLKVEDSEILVMFANLVNKKNKVKKEKNNDNKLPTPPAKKTKVEDVEMADKD